VVLTIGSGNALGLAGGGAVEEFIAEEPAGARAGPGDGT